MVRPGTPAEKFIGHARHDDLIGISNHKKRKTCVIYKDQPYFETAFNQTKNIIMANSLKNANKTMDKLIKSHTKRTNKYGILGR